MEEAMKRTRNIEKSYEGILAMKWRIAETVKQLEDEPILKRRMVKHEVNGKYYLVTIERMENVQADN